MENAVNKHKKNWSSWLQCSHFYKQIYCPRTREWSGQIVRLAANKDGGQKKKYRREMNKQEVLRQSCLLSDEIML